MFDWFALPDVVGTVTAPDAIDLVRSQHDALKDLFDRFKKARDRRTKNRIVRESLAELKIHAVVEEEILYPAVRRGVGRDIMNKADEEHHVAKVLIAELEKMNGHGDHYDAKFDVLAENVLRHIKEEESELLPKAHHLDLDFVKLGQQMQRKRTASL